MTIILLRVKKKSKGGDGDESSEVPVLGGWIEGEEMEGGGYGKLGDFREDCTEELKGHCFLRLAWNR